MAGNTFGTVFRLTTFGESHGKAIGGVIDGCPPGMEVDHELIRRDLNRRKPGQSQLTSPRREADEVELLSGIFENKTTGAPVGFIIPNKDQKPADYDHLKDAYRPSHADYTYEQKYGIRDHRGGGRASARETVARVVAGSFAKMILGNSGIDVRAYTHSIGGIIMNAGDVDLSVAEDSPVRCPDPHASGAMVKLIEETREAGDTLGGVVECRVTGAPAGLGEPVFDKLHADLAKAMLSINAVKGFEIGSGFEAASMKGSEHNDLFERSGSGITTSTNFSGGIQGGISNGREIVFRIAFKPVATLMKDQETVTASGEKKVIPGKGRHDVCVVPRAVPVVEAMAALVLADHLLLRNLY